MDMVDYVNRKSLQLCIKTGWRFMECKRFVMDVVWDTFVMGDSQILGIGVTSANFDEDYRQYDKQMREAGYK